MLQTGIFTIIAIQLLTLGAIALLLTSNRRTRGDLKIIRRRVTEMYSHVEATSDLVTKQSRDYSMIIEANRYRAAHPELWKWEPEQRDQAQASREYDENWEDWKEGDQIAWEDNKQGEVYTITHINHNAGYVYWQDQNGEQMTRSTNMVRIINHGDQAQASGENWPPENDHP